MMTKTAWFVIFVGLACWSVSASAQQRGGAPDAAAPAAIICAGTPQAAAPAARGGGGGRGAAAAPPTGVAPPAPVVTTTDIPGVIKSGLTWTQLFEATGNNGDGIVADKDGNIYFAQEINSAVVKIDKNDKVAVFAESPGTGSLAVDQKGRILTVQKMALPNAPQNSGPKAPPTAGIAEVWPNKRILADTFEDGSKWTGNPGDLAVDNRGGAYMVQGCLYYADPAGTIHLAADDLRANGITMSPDYKILYVTHAAPPAPSTVVAFDVQPDGKLTNRRTFATLREGNGNGAGADAAGRVYVPVGAAIQVFAKDGMYLGSIPTPGGVISVAFGGPNHRTLYAVINAGAGLEGVQPTRRVFRIPALATGLKNRGK